MLILSKLIYKSTKFEELQYMSQDQHRESKLKPTRFIFFFINKKNVDKFSKFCKTSPIVVLLLLSSTVWTKHIIFFLFSFLSYLVTQGIRKNVDLFYHLSSRSRRVVRYTCTGETLLLLII